MKKRLLALLTLLALCLCLSAAAQEQAPIRFTFFQMEGYEDMEIGDSCLIQFPGGETMLVDTLEPDWGDMLVDALRDMGVERLDALLLTHMHIDHIGGAAHVLYALPVDALYGPGEPYHTATYGRYAAARQAKGLAEQPLKTGDTLAFGDVTLTVLNPDIPPDAHEKFVSGDISVALSNQYSIVFMLEYGDFRALFTGDIYQVTENNLVKAYGEQLQCDLLKIPHHGFDTSSGSSFLKAARPDVAVAMGNVPLNTWLRNRYARLGIETYLTLTDGTITVTAYPDGRMEIATQHARGGE